MKKNLFGYNISQVDMLIDTLREENEALNAALSTLKIEQKNYPGGRNAKYILLEENLKKCEDNLIKIAKEKNQLESQLLSLKEKSDSLIEENKKLTEELSNIQAQKLDKIEKDVLDEVAITNQEIQTEETNHIYKDTLEQISQLLNNINNL